MARWDIKVSPYLDIAPFLVVFATVGLITFTNLFGTHFRADQLRAGGARP